MSRVLAAAGVAACATALAAAGCAASGGGIAGSGAAAETARPAFEVISSRPAREGDALRAEDLEPLAVGSVRWRRAEGGEPFCVKTTGTAPRFEREDPVATRTLVRADDGTVSLERQRDATDGAVLVFTSPLLLAPARLAPGEEPASTSGIVTEREKARDNDGGRAQRTMRIASVDRVRTPMGEFDAVRVDATLAMKVPFASLRRETSTWVRAGVGPVAVRSDERVLVMGVVPRNRTETRVRLPEGGGAP